MARRVALLTALSAYGIAAEAAIGFDTPGAPADLAAGLALFGAALMTWGRGPRRSRS
jgi:hypothetical protein